VKLGLDIDGVVLDFVSAFCRVCQRHGIGLTYEAIFCHDLAQVVGVGRAKVHRLIGEALESGLIEPYPGAAEGLRALRRGGHRVELVTSRPLAFRGATEAILHHHGLEYESLLFAQYLKKVEVVDGLDVVVEDSIEEALAFYDSPLAIILMRHPWNRNSLNAEQRFRYVDDWAGLLEAVDALGADRVRAGAEETEDRAA
jgi:uncharacterized HAD superfamily protein